jgi:hypothetical protein
VPESAASYGGMDFEGDAGNIDIDMLMQMSNNI